MRQLLNLIYMHLRPSPAVGCRDECGPGTCPRCQFHAALESPMPGRDQQRAERRGERADALLRGEIPK